MAGLILLIVSFVVLSGLLAMLDAAFLSVSRAEVEETLVHGLWGGRALSTIARRQMRTVMVIVILTNIVNILVPIYIGIRASVLFGSQALGILTAFLTALTILFSEIIPKALGTRYAPTISRYCAPVLLLLVTLLSPILGVIEMLVRPFRRGERPTGTEAQIRALARIGEEQGHIDEDERRLITRTFVLNDRMAKDLMMPRTSMIAIPALSNVRQAAAIAASAPHYRYPVYRDSLDDIVGFVLARDLLEAFVQGHGEEPITSIMKEPLFVAGTLRADDLLELLRKKRLHLAVVQDKAKNTLGVVTLHDVLEELVGEMEGERRA